MSEDRLDDLESRVATLGDLAIANDGDIESLEAEVASLREEIQALREDLADVQDLAELLTPGEDTQMSKEQRAALALATMYKTAMGGNGVATMDAGDVQTANQGEIKRAWAFEVMEAIPALVDDEDVCWIIREERNAPDNTRVVLDLSEGSVPASAAGVRIHNGGAPADD